MKTFLILVASLSLLTGCAKHFSSYPRELKDFHLLQIKELPLSPEMREKVSNPDDLPLPDDKIARCLKFQVEGVNPYKFKFVSIVNIQECHELVGYNVQGNLKLWNWVDDTLKTIDQTNCYAR